MRVIILDKTQTLHRLAWLYVHGYLPKEIDHINRDKADNRLCNLREVTRAENMANKPMKRDNTTGFKGVYRRRDKWYSQKMRNGVVINVGTFSTPEEASEAYERA